MTGSSNGGGGARSRARADEAVRRIEADANRSNLHAFPLPDAWGIDMYLKDRDRFTQLFHGEDAVSRVFLDVIQRRLVATLGQTLRPHARLAASL